MQISDRRQTAERVAEATHTGVLLSTCLLSIGFCRHHLSPNQYGCHSYPFWPFRFLLPSDSLAFLALLHLLSSCLPYYRVLLSLPSHTHTHTSTCIHTCLYLVSGLPHSDGPTHAKPSGVAFSSAMVCLTDRSGA
ncbi:unnamed protein product [Protopolystoma xenopodis]|uniref:Uncharacterized protein n=1 Tax=Protopolystoma xenopodis TaxID=117903 RepID=A0A3S5B7R4_9PLAT|nr:unnamed protein product [Protopolystoma xenopodis]